MESVVVDTLEYLRVEVVCTNDDIGTILEKRNDYSSELNRWSSISWNSSALRYLCAIDEIETILGKHESLAFCSFRLFERGTRKLWVKNYRRLPSNEFGRSLPSIVVHGRKLVSRHLCSVPFQIDAFYYRFEVKWQTFCRGDLICDLSEIFGNYRSSRR